MEIRIVGISNLIGSTLETIAKIAEEDRKIAERQVTRNADPIAMKEKLQSYFDEEGYYVTITKTQKFNDFIVLTCEEYCPCGPNTTFDLISTEGKFYNSNFDDIIEMNEELKEED